MMYLFNKIVFSIKRDKDFLYLFFILSILTYGMLVFNLTLHADDWRVFQIDKFQFDWVVQLGRWLQRVIWTIFDDNYFVPVFSMAFLLFFIYLSSLLIFKTLKMGIVSFYVFVIMFSFHSILVEIVGFEMAHIPLGFAILFSSISFYFLIESLKLFLDKIFIKSLFNLLISSISLSFVASIYQPIVFISLQLVIFYIIYNLFMNKNILSKIVFLYITMVLLSIIFYIIEIKISLIIFDIQGLHVGSTYTFRLFSNFNIFVLYSFDLFKNFIFYEQYSIPLAVKYLFLFGLFYLIILSFQRLVIKNAIISLSLLSILIFSPFILGLLVNDVASFRPNALISIASLYAIIFSLLYELVKEKYKYIILILISYIIIIFIFQHNKISIMSITNNKRDFAIANRILNRIETSPNYSTIRELESYDLIVVGVGLQNISKGKVFNSISSFNKNTLGFNSIIPKDMNIISRDIGVFSLPFGQIEYIFKLLGSNDSLNYYNWTRLPKNYNKKLIIDKLKNANPWPSKDSVIEFKNGYILVLNDNYKKIINAKK